MLRECLRLASYDVVVSENLPIRPWWEVESTLPNPPMDINQAGDESGMALKIVSRCLTQHYTQRILTFRRTRLPIPERLVARHPHPLPIGSIAERGIGEDGVISRVIRIKTPRIQAIAEIIPESRLAPTGEIPLAPVSKPLQRLLHPHPLRARDLGRIRLVDRVLHEVAPGEEAAVVVELVALPQPGRPFQRAHEVVVVFDFLQAELGFELVDLFRRARR